MSAYLQMGHDSENLIGVPGLQGFTGVVLSPVNRSESELRERVPQLKENGPLEVMLDPQLYCSKYDRRQLPKHLYFPKDLDTADLSSDSWRQEVTKRVAAEAVDLGVDAVCSRVVLPKKYGPDTTLAVEMYMAPWQRSWTAVPFARA